MKLLTREWIDQFFKPVQDDVDFAGSFRGILQHQEPLAVWVDAITALDR